MSRIPISADFIFNNTNDVIIMFDLWNTIIDCDSLRIKDPQMLEFLSLLRNHNYILVLISISPEEETRRLLGQAFYYFHYCAYNISAQEMECFGKSANEMLFISSNFYPHLRKWHLSLDLPLCSTLIDIFDTTKSTFFTKKRHFMSQVKYHNVSANTLLDSRIIPSDKKVLRNQSTSSILSPSTSNLLLHTEDSSSYYNPSFQARDVVMEDSIHIVYSGKDGISDTESVTQYIQFIRSQWAQARDQLLKYVDNFTIKVHGSNEVVPKRRRSRIGSFLWNSIANIHIATPNTNNSNQMNVTSGPNSPQTPHSPQSAKSAFSVRSSHVYQNNFQNPNTISHSSPQTPPPSSAYFEPQICISSPPQADELRNSIPIPKNYLFSYQEPIEIPILNKTEKKITLCLNLDGTLIHTIRSDDGLNVNIRPYCRYFLSELSNMSDVFDIILFTSAPIQYTRTVIASICQFSVFSSILHRDNCSLLNGNYIKDINLIGRDCCMIIDYNPFRMILNHRDGIPVPCWRREDKSDTNLLSVLEVIKLVYAKSFAHNDPQNLRAMLRYEIWNYFNG